MVIGNAKVIFFDFMGTCLDWHSSIVRILPARIDSTTRSSLAIAWREAFFDEIHRRFEGNLPPEDIDATHARCLKAVLNTRAFVDVNLSDQEQEAAVKAWHGMTAWPDVGPALSRLKDHHEVFVLANGTTRLQLDLAKSSGLSFDMMFSSQLLGLSKPDPEIYVKALRLVAANPQDAVMVAAHAYDLRAAKEVGMRTVYIRRWTEDTREDLDQVRKDVDWFFGSVERPAGDHGQLDGSLNILVDACVY